MARLKNRLFQINQSSLHHSALDFFHCCKKYESAKKRSSFRQTISTLDKVMILTQGCIFQTETFLFQFVPDTTDINAAFPIASLSLYSSFSISLSFSFLLSPSTHLSQSLSFSFLLSPSIHLSHTRSLSLSHYHSLSLSLESLRLSPSRSFFLSLSTMNKSQSPFALKHSPARTRPSVKLSFSISLSLSLLSCSSLFNKHTSTHKITV